MSKVAAVAGFQEGPTCTRESLVGCASVVMFVKYRQEPGAVSSRNRSARSVARSKDMSTVLYARSRMEQLDDEVACDLPIDLAEDRRAGGQAEGGGGTFEAVGVRRAAVNAAAVALGQDLVDDRRHVTTPVLPTLQLPPRVSTGAGRSSRRSLAHAPLNGYVRLARRTLCTSGPPLAASGPSFTLGNLCPIKCPTPAPSTTAPTWQTRETTATRSLKTLSPRESRTRATDVWYSPGVCTSTMNVSPLWRTRSGGCSRR